MDTSQWLTLIGVVLGTFSLLVTAMSLTSIIRAWNTAPELHQKAMALAISQVLQEEQDCQTACRRIDDIERRYVGVAKGEEVLALRKLAARRAFDDATLKGASFAEVSARFQRMCEIGFSSLHSEMWVMIGFAYVCLEHGHREESQRVLAQASKLLHEDAIDSQSRVAVLIERCEQLLGLS